MCNFVYVYFIPLHDLHPLFIVLLNFQGAEKRFQQKEKLGNILILMGFSYWAKHQDMLIWHTDDQQINPPKSYYFSKWMQNYSQP